MTATGWRRVDVVERLEAGSLRVAEAARILGLSVRQVKRLRKVFRLKGVGGLVHGNTGRAPAHRTPSCIREKVVELRRGKYTGFNDTHFTEKLLEKERVELSRESVRRILRGAGEGAVRRRRARKHRSRRERSAQTGMMLLWDGSRHSWLEERGPLLCMMAAVDDASGEVMPGAHFVQQECAAGYMRVLKATCATKGIPLAIYMDKHGSLKRNDGYWTLEEELAGEQRPTQVGEAMAELGIRVIHALSPQAKGRVERLWGVLQDRLVSEMRVAGAKTLDEAQAVLDAFIPTYNKRFGVPPRETTTAFLKVPPGMKLEKVCSFRYLATVGNDNAVRTNGEVIDIPQGPGGRSYAKARVDVRQLLDGNWRVYLKDELIAAKQGHQMTSELRTKRRTKESSASKAFKHALKTWQPVPRKPKRRPARRRRSPGGPIPFNVRPARPKKSTMRVTESLRS